MNVLRGKEQKEWLVLFLLRNKFLGLINEHIGHSFIVPQRRLATPLVADPANPIDHRIIVSMTTWIISHRGPVFFTVGVLGRNDSCWLFADKQWISGVEPDDSIIF